MTYTIIFINKTNFQSDPDKFLFSTSAWKHAHPMLSSLKAFLMLATRFSRI